MIFEVGHVRSVEETVSKSGYQATVLTLAVPGQRWDRAARSRVPTIQLLPFKCFGFGAGVAMNLKPGELVKVEGHVDAREWQGRIFVDLVADQLVKLDAGDTARAGAEPEPEPGGSGNVPF